MDQQLVWNDLLLNQVETHNLPDSPLFAGDASMPFIDLTSDESADLSIWSPGGPSSSQAVRTEERQLEPTDMILGSRADGRVENLNLNLNDDHVDELLPFPLHSSFLQTPDLNAGQALGHFPMIPFIPGSSGSLQVPSPAAASNLSGSSSRGVGLLTERGKGIAVSPFNGRRLSCKRKSIEGVASGSSGSLHQNDDSLLHSVPSHQRTNTTLSIASSLDYPSATSSFGEQLNPRIGTTASVRASDQHTADRAVSSQRNCRSRISAAEHATLSPSQWTQGNNNLRLAGHWSGVHQEPNFVPINQSSASRVVVAAAGTPESQPPVLQVPALLQNVHSFPVTIPPSSSRTVSRSAAIAVQRPTASREDTNSRRLQREHSPFNPLDMRHLMQQHPSSWSLAHAPQPGSSGSRAVQSPGPTWMPRQNASSQVQRDFPVALRRPSVSSGGSGSGPTAFNAPPQPSASFSAMQEARAQTAANVRGLHQSYVTPGVLGVPLALRSLAITREGSRRALSEHIRNAIQLAWRGERQLEDALFEHAVFYGVPHDLHDRHRDMRLDVDNMSYEELLALEERIGNVNTGVSEETILKCLKQRKYFSLTEEKPGEEEPCCVCQEEYVEEEDIGRLDCGHDFHATCIKKWLMLKNLCPICKTTGLKT